MKSWGIGALGVVVAVGLFFLLWELRSSSRPAAHSAAKAQDHGDRPADVPSKRLGAKARMAGDSAGGSLPDEPSTDDPGPPRQEGDVGAPAADVPLAALLAAAKKHLADEAFECDEGPGVAAGTVTVRYTVVFDGEWAHVEDASVVDASVQEAAVRTCVLEQVRGARWRLAVAANSRAQRTESFVVGGNPSSH